MKGVQVTGMVQYYSALPFNITTGTTTIQGTPARPAGEWRVHSEKFRRGQPFLDREPSSA